MTNSEFTALDVAPISKVDNQTFQTLVVYLEHSAKFDGPVPE